MKLGSMGPASLVFSQAKKGSLVIRSIKIRNIRFDMAISCSSVYILLDSISRQPPFYLCGSCIGGGGALDNPMGTAKVVRMSSHVLLRASSAVIPFSAGV